MKTKIAYRKHNKKVEKKNIKNTERLNTKSQNTKDQNDAKKLLNKGFITYPYNVYDTYVSETQKDTMTRKKERMDTLKTKKKT